MPAGSVMLAKPKVSSPASRARKSRNEPVRYDKRPYKPRRRIEIRFGRFKALRRVATRDDRCPTAFSIALVAIIIF